MKEKKDMENNEKLNIQGLKKENNFKIPDGYFDEFPMRMQERLEMENKKAWNFSFSVQRPKLVLAYAFASIIVVATSIWFLNNMNNATQQPFMSGEEIAQIVDFDIMGYDENMIIDEFINSGADFSALDIDNSTYDYSVDDIDLEQILNQL